MTSQFFTIGTTDPEHWEEILQRCGAYDVYHLPEYHRLAEEQEDAQAVLCVLETESAIIAMPFLIRRIEGLPGIVSSKYRDATSVYGYPGPVSNLQNPSEEVMHLFAESLRSYFEKEKVISAFSRLHPFVFFQESYLNGINSQLLEVGPTAAIDLNLPVDVQRQQYRTNHKRGINKARREGVRCIHDQNWRHFDAFIDIYYQTMERNGATEDYFFDREYFVRLRALLGNHLHLFVALKDDVVISGGLFTICNSIIQYHLGGTDSRYLKLAPSKLIFDTVRLWGTEIGATIFHLGGGVGSREDSLFRFKAGFSSLKYQFKVWRMVVNQEVYEQLVEQKRSWNDANGFQSVDNNYFPAYRHQAKLKETLAPSVNMVPMQS